MKVGKLFESACSCGQDSISDGTWCVENKAVLSVTKEELTADFR
jgi:hypothetical protein